MSSTIEIKDVAAIPRLSIPIPEDGGIVVLRGRNGAGKSEAIAAVDALIAGEGKLDRRDGAVSNGRVEGFGATITVGKSTTRCGEAEVVSLDGRLNIADLVDPKLKTPDAADDRRIKALIGIAGTVPDVKLFDSVLGELAAHVNKSSLEGGDIVQIASRIKRDLNDAANATEKAATVASVNAKAQAEGADGIDMTAMSSEVLLNDALESAIRSQSALQTKRTEAELILANSRTAREELEKAEAGRSVISVEDAQRALAEVTTERDQLAQALEAAKEAARKAQSDCDEVFLRVRLANEAVASAAQHESTVVQWRESIDKAAVIEQPTEAEITAAVSVVEMARSAVATGLRVRDARLRLTAAAKHDEEAARLTAKATALREAAKGTDTVLSNIVAGLGTLLRVDSGRLVLDTARGKTYFADLSAGERWRVALDVAITAVGEHGVMTVPQEAWEGLDDENRAAINEQVKGTGVVIITAECRGQVNRSVASSIYTPQESTN